MPWFMTPYGPQHVIEPGTIDEFERRDYVALTAQQAADYFAGVAFPDPPSFVTEAELTEALAGLGGGGGTVPNASTTVKGVVELATNAETTTGTDTTRAVTPAGVKAVIDALPVGSGTGVDATDVGFDVVLVIGQSNAQGLNEDYLARLAPIDPRIWAWEAGGTLAGKLSQSPAVGLQHQGGDSGLGPGHPFGLEYVASAPPNRRVLLVPAAYSGTSFSAGGGGTGNVWDSDGTNNLYTGAIALTKAALGSHLNNRLAAVLWHQGESAVGLSQAQYAAKLDALIGKLRTDLAAPNVPFLVGGLVPEWVGSDSARLAIQAALAATPSRVARTAYTAGPFSAKNADGIHYNAPGQVLLGRGYAQALPYAKDNTTPGTSPTLPAPAAVAGLDGTANGTDIGLAWNPVPGAYNYRVEHRTAAGAGAWTEDVITFGSSFTISGLAATTAYELRVTTLGPGGDSTPATTTETTGAATGGGGGSAFSTTFDGTAGTRLNTLGWIEPAAAAGLAVHLNGVGGARMVGDGPGDAWAVRDLGVGGTITATLNDGGTGAGWTCGILVRYVDDQNYIRITDGQILTRVSGSNTQLVAGLPSLSGTVVVTLNGPTITVVHNGTQVAQVTTSTHQSATKHGFEVNYSEATCDSFAWEPAA